jgi:hypothetical protein
MKESELKHRILVNLYEFTGELYSITDICKLNPDNTMDHEVKLFCKMEIIGVSVKAPSLRQALRKLIEKLHHSKIIKEDEFINLYGLTQID